MPDWVLNGKHVVLPALYLPITQTWQSHSLLNIDQHIALMVSCKAVVTLENKAKHNTNCMTNVKPVVGVDNRLCRREEDHVSLPVAQFRIQYLQRTCFYELPVIVKFTLRIIFLFIK